MYMVRGSMYIVTGASDNHFASLMQFLRSLSPQQHADTFVWNFGLSNKNQRILQTSLPALRLRRFPYENYPSWFDIRVNAGEYAWKPVAIYLTALEVGEGVLLWCDAGNRLVGPPMDIEAVIRKQSVYSPISVGTVGKWTHPGCLAWFGLDSSDPVLDKLPRNGAILGFDLGNGSAWQLLEEWAHLAQQKDCIAPAGSSRDNHRQDQAVFTILYYRYTNNKSLHETNISLLTHQDCDPDEH
jgi:hypothetical protein